MTVQVMRVLLFISVQLKLVYASSGKPACAPPDLSVFHNTAFERVQSVDPIDDGLSCPFKEGRFLFVCVCVMFYTENRSDPHSPCRL